VAVGHRLDRLVCDGHVALVTALSEADPALECWTFLPAPSPLTMWARRQAHETAVHRVDAQLANGRGVVAFPASFAADGIDELLSCFITRRRWRLKPAARRRLRFRCSDAEGDWLVQISADGVNTTPGGNGAECDVVGLASDLYLTLWSRRSSDELTISGDRGALQEFLEGVHVRWS
jgi:uncharacterized protein (TIGR03083 family)